MSATYRDWKLDLLKQDIQCEEMRVRHGWGDPEKLAKSLAEHKALHDRVMEERTQDWEAYKAAHRRVLPKPALAPIAKDNPLWVLAGMGYDETLEEAVARVQHYYEER